MIEKKLITPEIYAAFRRGENIIKDHYDENSDLHIAGNSYFFRISRESYFKICDYKTSIKEARKICKFLLKRDHIFSDIDYEKKEEHLNQEDIYDLIVDTITEIVKNKTGKDCLFYCFEDRFALKIRN